MAEGTLHEKPERHEKRVAMGRVGTGGNAEMHEVLVGAHPGANTRSPHRNIIAKRCRRSQANRAQVRSYKKTASRPINEAHHAFNPF